MWSYGVTLWEALSYGSKPYQVCVYICVCVLVLVYVYYGVCLYIQCVLPCYLSSQNMQGQEILKMIEGGQRMNPPKDCPPDLYDVMLSCWNYM